MSNLYDLLKKVEEANLTSETQQYLTNVIQLGPDKLTPAAIEKIVNEVLEIKE
jgi:hypothetical protein